MRKLFFFLFLTMNLVSCTGNKQQRVDAKEHDKDSLFLLVGGYASPEAEGVKLYAFNQSTGDLNYVSGLKGVSNPSYLTPSADGKYVYAVSENENETAAANVLSLDLKKGKLELLDSRLTHGSAPCFIALSPREDFVVTANYLGGNISIFDCKEKGKLSEPQVISFSGHGFDSERQEQAHLHCIGFAPNEQYMFAVDLGLDCVHVFPLKREERQACSLVENHETAARTMLIDEALQRDFKIPSGAGPRHLCFSPDQKFVYLISELSGDVFVMKYKGAETEILQTIKADSLGAKGSADIHLTPNGKFLYASNRLKGDGIAIFKVDQRTGLLTKVGYQSTGIHPRNFVISPNGKFLLVACRFSNTIEIYEIDDATGLLKPKGKNVSTSEPSCLKFVS